MFDTTRSGREGGRQVGGRIAALPVAVAVHALVLGAVVVGQLWAVEGVPEPTTAVTFFTLPPPPPPLGGSGGRAGRSHAAVRTAARTVEAQPNAIPETAASRIEPPPGQGDGNGVPGGDPQGGGNGVPGGVPSEFGPSASAEPGADTVLPVHLASGAPVPLLRPAPEYPELARRARVTGTVVLQAVIDREGNVVDVTIVKDLPLGCGEAARAAVRRWRYAPATLNGRTVSVLMTVTVTFELRGAS